MKNVALAILLVAGASSALADNMYIAGSLGSVSSEANKSDIDRTLTNAGAVGVTSSVDDSDSGYKLQVGYQLDPYVALEGGYVSLGKMNYSGKYTGGGANAEIKAAGWNLGIVLTLPIYQGLSAFGRIGTIYGNVKSHLTATGSASAVTKSTEDTEWKPTWGVGASYDINKMIGVRVEYEQFANLGNKNSIGTTSDINLISTGLVVKF